MENIMTEIDPQKAVDYLRDNAEKYAEAKASRVYLEEFRKSKKSLLMLQSDEKTQAGKEAYAYAHDEYIALLDGLKVAIETEETVKWQMIAAQARIEVWRTQQANNRNIVNSTR
jgi:hypothetical protein